MSLQGAGLPQFPPLPEVRSRLLGVSSMISFVFACDQQPTALISLLPWKQGKQTQAFLLAQLLRQHLFTVTWNSCHRVAYGAIIIALNVYLRDVKARRFLCFGSCKDSVQGSNSLSHPCSFCGVLVVGLGPVSVECEWPRLEVCFFLCVI